MTPQICPGCKLELPPFEGPVHRYMEASPGCWGTFGRVLAREYSDLAYMTSHRLTVDAYAVQHPGQPSPQSIKSVAVHLISLFAVFEHNFSNEEATSLIKRSAEQLKFCWLEPPEIRGKITIFDVLKADTPDDHSFLVRNWANEVWSAWSPHWGQVEKWADEAWAN